MHNFFNSVIVFVFYHYKEKMSINQNAYNEKLLNPVEGSLMLVFMSSNNA